MPEIYCVKERKFTPNKKGTEKIIVTKNGRRMMQAKCASCGITKSLFLPPEEVMPHSKTTPNSEAPPILSDFYFLGRFGISWALWHASRYF